GKRGEDGDRADRDHGEDDSVLRHRLTLLLAPMRPEKLKPLGKRHVDSPPFLFARAPTGALQEVPCFESESVLRPARLTPRQPPSFVGAVPPPPPLPPPPTTVYASAPGHPSTKLNPRPY